MVAAGGGDCEVRRDYGEGRRKHGSQIHSVSLFGVGFRPIFGSF